MNHQEEAQERLGQAFRALGGGHTGDAQALAVIAQTQATLAVAEQLRIANLIALCADEHQEALDTLFDLANPYEMRPNIAAALGVGDVNPVDTTANNAKKSAKSLHAREVCLDCQCNQHCGTYNSVSLGSTSGMRIGGPCQCPQCKAERAGASE